MPTYVKPEPSQYEAEYRYQFQARTPRGPHVIVQGSVITDLRGHSDDDNSEYVVELLVGPFWKRSIEAVVPSVTINGFWNSNADEDDQQLWEIKNLTWDSVNEFGKTKDEFRVRLTFTVLVRGEESHIIRLGYYLVASGVELGDGGLNAPEPVKPNG